MNDSVRLIPWDKSHKEQSALSGEADDEVAALFFEMPFIEEFGTPGIKEHVCRLFEIDAVILQVGLRFIVIPFESLSRHARS